MDAQAGVKPLDEGRDFWRVCTGPGPADFSGEHPDPAKYFLIGLLVFLTAVAQLWINHPDTFQKNSRVGLVFGVILFHLCVAKLVMVLSTQSQGGLPKEFGVY